MSLVKKIFRLILEAVVMFAVLFVASFVAALALPFRLYWGVTAMLSAGAVVLVLLAAMRVSRRLRFGKKELRFACVAAVLSLAPVCGGFTAEYARLKHAEQQEQHDPPSVDSVLSHPYARST